MAYKSIDGVEYEKELLDLDEKRTTGRREGKPSKDEAAELFASPQDSSGVTGTERRTPGYTRNHFEFTGTATQDFDKAFARGRS
jgi:hypothetical protein